jgi:hypothetical protein
LPATWAAQQVQALMPQLAAAHLARHLGSPTVSSRWDVHRDVPLLGAARPAVLVSDNEDHGTPLLLLGTHSPRTRTNQPHMSTGMADLGLHAMHTMHCMVGATALVGT